MTDRVQMHRLDVTHQELYDLLDGIEKQWQHFDDDEGLDPEVHADIIDANARKSSLLQWLWFIYSGSRTGMGEYKGDGSAPDYRS